MQSFIEAAYIVRANRADNGTVYVSLIGYGRDMISAYAKSGPVADALKSASEEGPMAAVACHIRTFAGTDRNTRQPNGKLSVLVTSCAPVDPEYAAAVVAGVVPAASTR